MNSIYVHEMTRIDEKSVEKIEKYRGKILLIVNTASHCGYTPQFAELEALYKIYHDKGFEVLGFPCNQFFAQNPESNNETLNFCQLNYGVSFPMFAKINVRGRAADPLFKFLVAETGGQAIKWNFTKFLVDANGNVIKRYAPKITPLSIGSDIEKLL